MRKVNLVLIVFALTGSGCNYGEKSTAEKVSSTVNEAYQVGVKHDQPVSGFLNGRKMVADRSVIKDGIMTIRQGDDFFAYRQLQIFFFEDKPVENYVIDSKVNSGLAPHIYMSWQDKGDGLPKTETMVDGYDLTLSFGMATEFGMPYSITFTTNKFKDTQISGNSFATFKELKVRDSVVDRSFDSFDTLEYVAREYLKQQAGEIVTIVDRFDDYIQAGNAYIGIEYRQGDKPVEMARLQFRKFEAGWKMVNRLADNLLEAAHPYNVEEAVIGTEKGGGHIGIITARLVEDEYNKLGLVPMFRATDMRCSLINGYVEGNCEYSFRIKKHNGNECNIRNIHLKYLDGKWEILNEIDPGYRYDFTSGNMVKDKYGSKLCPKEEKLQKLRDSHKF